MERPQLTFLFEAHFADGVVIKQTLEDRIPEEPTKSDFTRVERKMKICAINWFALYEVNGNRWCAVDIRNGRFEFNGEVFEAQPDSKNLPPGGTYALVYFRDGEITQSSYADSGEIISETHRILGYRIGWKYRVGNREYIQTIVVR